MTKSPATRIAPRWNRTAACARMIVLGGALYLSVVGCGDEPRAAARVVTYPVHGKLLIDGVPAMGAMVKLYSEQKPGRVPTALVRADGSFSASFYDNEDGAPAGQYKVLVVWMQPPPEGGMPQDRLQGQFLDPRKPVRSVEVLERDNQLGTIELTTRQRGPTPPPQ